MDFSASQSMELSHLRPGVSSLHFERTRRSSMEVRHFFDRPSTILSQSGHGKSAREDLYCSRLLLEKDISATFDSAKKPRVVHHKRDKDVFKLEQGVEDEIVHSLETFYEDIVEGLGQCHKRQLISSMKWLAECGRTFDDSSPFLHGILHPKVRKPAVILRPKNRETTSVLKGKCFLETGENLRAAFTTRECSSLEGVFLHHYSKYLAAEKKRHDHCPSVLDTCSTKDPLEDVLQEFQKVVASTPDFDGYFPYLAGKIKKRLGDDDNARLAFAESVRRAPLNWDAWAELAELIPSKDILVQLKLPKHWMYYFFEVRLLKLLEKNFECVALGECLSKLGFARNPSLICDLGIVFHNICEAENAVELLMWLRDADPYRIDHMDVFSNLLYVQECDVQLSCLAQTFSKVAKFKTETQCVLGNLNSLRGNHEKSILHFQRVLKINPSHKFAWTLLGHEFIQLTEPLKAIQCYRNALKTHSRDFRAWYGLGQAYEVLKMHSYSLYYYQNAQLIQPYDVRMHLAMGIAYEEMGRWSNARYCYERASKLHDPENIGFFRLADMYAKLGLDEFAAKAFVSFLTRFNESGRGTIGMVTRAHLFLAIYFIRKEKYKAAEWNALSLLDYVHAREKGKRCLELISLKMTERNCLTSKIVPVLPTPKILEAEEFQDS